MDISDFVKKAKEYNVLGIKISKDNELAAEWYSEPECRRNIYSAAKSFTSCAVGFAVQEELIDLNEKLTEAFSGDLPECIDENLKKGYTLKGLYCVEYGTGIKKKIKNGNVITLDGMHYMLIEYKNVSKNYSYATFLFGK